jgi:hypothetical protein
MTYNPPPAIAERLLVGSFVQNTPKIPSDKKFAISPFLVEANVH